MSWQETQRSMPPVPASVQIILGKLQGHKPMTGKELREATGLPRRTIYTALRKLRELGILRERQSLRDTRQTYFWIPEGGTGASPGQDHPAAHQGQSHEQHEGQPQHA